MHRWDPPAAHYIALHTTGLCNLGPQEKYWAMKTLEFKCASHSLLRPVMGSVGGTGNCVRG